MKQRILTGWSYIRVIYILIGGLIIIQSASDKQWFGIIFGGYFAVMGLFAVGCASGSCYYQPGNKQNIKETEFKEVK